MCTEVCSLYNKNNVSSGTSDVVCHKPISARGYLREIIKNALLFSVRHSL